MWSNTFYPMATIWYMVLPWPPENQLVSIKTAYLQIPRKNSRYWLCTDFNGKLIWTWKQNLPQSDSSSLQHYMAKVYGFWTERHIKSFKIWNLCFPKTCPTPILRQPHLLRHLGGAGHRPIGK